MSENRISENMVICLDASRSMYRSDYASEYAPTRMQCCIVALKRLIEERLKEDSTSAFAIIKFNNKATRVQDFTAAVDTLFQGLDSVRFEGRSAMGDALALAIKMIISELRKVAAKTPRILVVSDGNYTRTAVDPLKMARLSQGLSIKIDSFRLGEVSHLNILKRLSDLTGGRYYYNNDAESLMNSALTLAEANVKKMGSGSGSPIENPAFLRKIAANLLRVQDLTQDQEQRLKQLRGQTDFKKCSICFSNTDPITKGSFLLTGRYCPHCQSPFHIHCLAGWANSQKDEKLKESGTCRCPHCFYLLKIPAEVTQAQRLASLSGKGTTIGRPDMGIVPARVIENVIELGEEALYNSCPVCHYIFEEGQKAVQCGSDECKALYHHDCFNKLADSRCKNCSVKLHLY